MGVVVARGLRAQAEGRPRRARARVSILRCPGAGAGGAGAAAGRHRPRRLPSVSVLRHGGGQRQRAEAARAEGTRACDGEAAHGGARMVPPDVGSLGFALKTLLANSPVSVSVSTTGDRRERGTGDRRVRAGERAKDGVTETEVLVLLYYFLILLGICSKSSSSKEQAAAAAATVSS